MSETNEPRVGEMLRNKSGRRYKLLAVTPNFWNDGATGYRLVRVDCHGDEVGVDFSVRPEDVSIIYKF